MSRSFRVEGVEGVGRRVGLGANRMTALRVLMLGREAVPGSPGSKEIAVTHPLDDARLKVDRAREHLTEIRAEIARYLDTRPYEFPTERDGDVLTAKPAIIKQEPPHRLRSVIGDVLGNLRPILDYIT